MALNTYLHLTLGGVAVTGSVTRVGLIEVISLEWSFDSDGNIGEIKFLADIDKAAVPIGQGLNPPRSRTRCSTSGCRRRAAPRRSTTPSTARTDA
jgi:hypothetical protein